MGNKLSQVERLQRLRASRTASLCPAGRLDERHPCVSTNDEHIGALSYNGAQQPHNILLLVTEQSELGSTMRGRDLLVSVAAISAALLALQGTPDVNIQLRW